MTAIQDYSEPLGYRLLNMQMPSMLQITGEWNAWAVRVARDAAACGVTPGEIRAAEQRAREAERTKSARALRFRDELYELAQRRVYGER